MNTTKCIVRSKVITINTIFFYIATFCLLSLIATYLFWQLESNRATYEFYQKTVILDKGNKRFPVNVNFCNPETREFTISKYYLDTLNNVYYPVPSGMYSLDDSDCINSTFIGFVGHLEPGVYQYHVNIEYSLNPLRSYSEKVAVVTLLVE